MRKRISICLIVVFILISLVGCESKSAESLDDLLKLGNKYLVEQNYEEAILAFEKALVIDKKCVDAYVGLAESYVGIGDETRAEEVLRSALELIDNEKIKEMLENLHGGEKDEGESEENVIENNMTKGMAKVAIKNDKEATFSLTVPNLPETFVINQEKVEATVMEYSWGIRFTDGINNYEVSICNFKEDAKEKQVTLEAVEFQKTLWKQDEGDSDCNNFVNDCEFVRYGDTLMWNVKMPDEFSFSNLKSIEPKIEILSLEDWE